MGSTKEGTEVNEINGRCGEKRTSLFKANRKNHYVGTEEAKDSADAPELSGHCQCPY